MFTGIIKDVGHIEQINDLGGGLRFVIASTFAPDLTVDESISVNGACQTVVQADATTFAVDSIEETLRKTTFSTLSVGDPVNLERPLQAGGRLDGHFVQGHVDATGTIEQVEREGTDWLYTVSFPEQYQRYLIPVGSITIDGISLTVARIGEATLTVAIIPHTYEHTIVSDAWIERAAVNLEFDMLGKYVVGFMEANGTVPGTPSSADL